ncbi:LacI family DNA-binding transcriptional regulator [Paraflavisolibacter sp. H34]|uniref:LacI family DNA-binding transcriptional regulator n=1 Tax=Huijunlia imazamoxiresistens TaxID=3127457 RepID=UPI003016E817
MAKFISTTDLAKALQLSPSTISRALNDHYSISAATKKRVLEYARKVGFQKNANALKLLHHKTNTVGILLPEVTSYFSSELIKGLKEVFDPSGLDMIILQSGERLDKEKQNLKFLLSARVDGLVYSPSKETATPHHLEPAFKNRIPFVNLDRGLAGLNCSRVMVDDENGAFQAVQHLVRGGCRRIAHLAGPANVLNAQNRLKGYRRALAAYGLPFDPALVRETGFKLREGIGRIEQFFDAAPPLDGIFAANDEIALGCLFVARQRGRGVPEDLAVVGFDDEVYASYSHPSLTSVHSPIVEMGRLAAQYCLQQINDEAPVSHEITLLQPQLVIRESSLRK